MAAAISDRDVSETFAFSCAGSLVDAVNTYATGLGRRDRIALGQRISLLGEALETAAAAELVGDDGDTRAAAQALGGRKTSKRAARRRAKRAGAAAKNPNIANKMATGALSGEQVDALLDANKACDGAIDDDSLVDEVAAASADATSKVIDDYITDKADNDSIQAEHDRQRRLRNVTKHRGRFGLSAVTVEGDAPSIDAIWKQLRADANHLYHQDGGRDVPLGSHPRTNDQRLYDALTTRITGNNATNHNATDGQPDRSAGTEPHGQPDRTDNTSQSNSTAPRGNETGMTARPIASRRYTPPRRPTIVITVTPERLLGDPTAAPAQQIGVGPIADTVLASYLADTELGVDLIGALFSTNGQPLWLGRRSRLATNAQYLALVVRDKGCVQCGASYDQCQIHHTTPWNSPAAGQTNIDELVLLCESCHHQLHDNNLTLYQHHTTGEWQTRPATPTETPPKRRPSTRRPKPTQARPTPRTDNQHRHNKHAA